MANGADIAAAAGAAVGASVVVGATESVVCIELKKWRQKENVRLMFAWCKEQVEPNVRRQWRGEEVRYVWKVQCDGFGGRHGHANYKKWHKEDSNVFDGDV